MTYSFRSILVRTTLIAALPLALPLGGCVVTQDGNTMTLETATRFEGTPKSQSFEYAAKESLSIVSHNGDVTVRPGSASDKIIVTYKPFTMDKDDEADRAKSEMNEKLHIGGTVTAGQGVTITTSVDKGASGLLGADIVVELPSGFNGAFSVRQGNGSVDANLTGASPTSTTVDGSSGSVKVSGAAGQLAISNKAGDIDVTVASWGAADGAVTQSGSGDISFEVGSDFNGSVQAQANQELVLNNLPSSWQVAEAAENSKTITMGAGGANVALTTDFGDIVISAR
jgi:hypothetical protein